MRSELWRLGFDLAFCTGDWDLDLMIGDMTKVFEI